MLAMARRTPFTVTAAFRGDAATVAVRGDADIVTAPTLEAMLAMALGNNPARLVLDLGRVAYLDCAAARVLSRAAGRLPPGQLVICRPTPSARRVLELTGLGHLLHDRPSRPAHSYPAPGSPRTAVAAARTGSA